MSRFDCTRMVVRFTTTYAISVYHQVVSLNPTQAIQHYVIKFVSDLQQSVIFSGHSGFLHQ
jgi:hypothetical protein